VPALERRHRASQTFETPSQFVHFLAGIAHDPYLLGGQPDQLFDARRHRNAAPPDEIVQEFAREERSAVPLALRDHLRQGLGRDILVRAAVHDLQLLPAPDPLGHLAQRDVAALFRIVEFAASPAVPLDHSNHCPLLIPRRGNDHVPHCGILSPGA